MAQSRVFSILGDSNIKRHMNDTNRRDRPAMSEAQVIPCSKLALFAASLRTVRETSNVCMISCLSNFLSDSDSTSSNISDRLEPVYKDFFAKIVSGCNDNPDRVYLVFPPMFRSLPVWYRAAMPEILTMFSTFYAKNALGVSNLHAMPSFPTPKFEDDGVHLTPYSGMEFVLFLFDRSNTVLDCLQSSPEVQHSKTAEVTRSLEDRMMAMEQSHRCLLTDFDLKCAVDSELACFRENERNEDSFLISGLPRIPSSLSGRDWQERAKSDVKKIISKLIDRPIDIVVVRNVSNRSGTTSSYSVQLSNVPDSRLIRSKFGSFFSKGIDNRPSDFKEMSISNVVTRETRIRIQLLKLYAKRYRDSNPGSKTLVVGYEPRPLLKLTPPQGVNQRIKTMTFIDAVRTLPRNLNPDDLAPIVRAAHSSFPGKVKSLFVVISDDMDRGVKTSRKRVANDDQEDVPPSQRDRVSS